MSAGKKSGTRRMLGIALVLLALVGNAEARNTRPSSGRPLEYGHWLTCWGGGDDAVRSDPDFNKLSDEKKVAAYVPEFSGSYSFEVKDTWEELVTKSGENCVQCGTKYKTVTRPTQQCTTDSKTGVQTCVPGPDETVQVADGCNYCTWQEIERFYRPWSVQNVRWHAKWKQNLDYRRRRQQWLANGAQDVGHSKSDIPKLQVFDPDRPLEYFLFPGEYESVRVSNDSGDYTSPSLRIPDARHEYNIATTINGRAGSVVCDDVDLNIETSISTIKRKVTKTPNSLVFKEGWLGAKKDLQGNASDEPYSYTVMDLSAQRYNSQNLMDHYKDDNVKIYLKLVNATWWVDCTISSSVCVPDLQAILMKRKAQDETYQPRDGAYEIPAVDLHKTQWFSNSFNLNPGRTYLVCGRVLRKSNIYYDSKNWYGGDAWSEANCAQFVYAPPKGVDYRTGGRKFHDFVEHIIPLW